MSRRWTALVVYDLLLWLAGLLLLPVALWHWCRSRDFRRRLPMRLGFGPKLAPHPRRVLLHGVSVGEVKALKPLLHELSRRDPGLELVVSSSTPTGLAFAERLYPDHRVVAYPLDLPDACARFLKRMDPALVILAELEIWPNFLRQCARRGVEVAIVNGRITDRSISGYRRVQRWLPQFDRIALYGVQNPRYADRFRSLDVPGDRVVVTGNLKYDDLPQPADEAAYRAGPWSAWAGIAPVVVFASTHEPEEVDLAVAWSGRAAQRDSLGVIVPRHPKRAEAILAALEGRVEGTVHRFSLLDRDARPAPGDWILVDAFGELGQVYRAARAAFVGGSLIPHGGQNMLEPAAAGCPVVVGPHCENFLEEVERLCEAGGLMQTEELAQVLEWLETWTQDPEGARTIGEAGRLALESGRGAAQSTVVALQERGLLPSSRGAGPAPPTAPRPS